MGRRPSNLIRYDETAVPNDAQRYLNARPVLDLLKRYAHQMDRQTVKTLRGLALSGDVAGALTGLERIMGFDARRERGK